MKIKITHLHRDENLASYQTPADLASPSCLLQQSIADNTDFIGTWSMLTQADGHPRVDIETLIC